MKKTASVFLALLLLGALFALPVSAAEESAAAASDPTVWQNGLFALWFRTLGGTQQLLTYALGNLLIVAAAYLLGSLNFAIIVSKKLYGKDIRKYGSHNAGMTNMFRTFGKKAGLLTLAGDAGKALVSVLLGRLLLGEDGAYLAGLFCILGHIAPAYYRFKGGKGVVVTAVTVAIIDPVIFAVLVVVFALVFLIWRYVSLASVIAAFVYPGAVFISAQIRSGGQGMPYMTAMLFSAFVALLILFLHRENIKRIFERTESKCISARKSRFPTTASRRTNRRPARTSRAAARRKNDGRAGAIRARRAEPASRLKRTAAQRRRGNALEGRKNAYAAG